MKTPQNMTKVRVVCTDGMVCPEYLRVGSVGFVRTQRANLIGDPEKFMLAWFDDGDVHLDSPQTGELIRCDYLEVYKGLTDAEVRDVFISMQEQYGITQVLNVTIEELAEFIQQCTKVLRKQGGLDKFSGSELHKFHEEVADVRVMMQQIELLPFYDEVVVQRIFLDKVQRTKDRYLK